jgi:uncharacterized membrane protein
MNSWTRVQRLALGLGLSSLLSVSLFVIRAIQYDTTRYAFLNWNLFLAWLPLVFALLLGAWLRKNPWVSWQGIVLTVLWLGFLPNSFYLVSDLIHLQTTTANHVLYDTVMLLSFAWNGLVLGFFSLYLVHLSLLKRLKRPQAHIAIASVLLICSFAIYLGRYLRWSTWDVLVNPAGILFDVSDRIINPSAHPQTFSTTFTFFLLLGSIYIVIWQFVAAIREQKHA